MITERFNKLLDNHPSIEAFLVPTAWLDYAFYGFLLWLITYTFCLFVYGVGITFCALGDSFKPYLSLFQKIFNWFIDDKFALKGNYMDFTKSKDVVNQYLPTEGEGQWEIALEKLGWRIGDDGFERIF